MASTRDRWPARPRDLVVVGASAGGVEALIRLAASLPADLPAALAVVLHVAPGSASVLPEILSRAGPLPAATACDGARLEGGRIVVAPPDLHLLVEGGRLRLRQGPRENRVRPSVDTLFRSAARDRGAGVVGVVLSGALDDGSAGLLAIRRAGGRAVVQSPGDALYPDMPQHALDLAGADHCVTMEEMGPLLARLGTESVKARRARERDRVTPADGGTPGRPPGRSSAFSCPECGGVLWESSGEALRFECRTGHAFSPASLAADQADQIEEALWGALRAIEELAALSRRLQGAATARGAAKVAERFARQAEEQDARLVALRALAGMPAPALPGHGPHGRVEARAPSRQGPRRREAGRVVTARPQS